jgi:hypothetical protein
MGGAEQMRTALGDSSEIDSAPKRLHG